MRAALGRMERRRDLLIEALHRLQDGFGALFAADLRALAEEFAIPQAEVFEVASFYHHFRIVKEGEAAPPALAIRVAFLQNTLEQAVLAGAFYFALAALAGGPWMALPPVAAVLFVVGRVLFFLGYRRGAGGRSFGMALTMLPAVVGYLLLAWLLIFGG